MSVHELHANVWDPTWKNAPVHWLALPVVHTCSEPAPEGHVVPSAAVHWGVPSPPGDEDVVEVLQPPSAPDAPKAKATAATAMTRTFIRRS